VGTVQGDYYAILGVSPSSEDVVIRAAYRALMRRYHPDADRSSDATDRARQINAAYAVLSNPEQRRKYDGTLAARGLIKLEHRPTPAAGVRVTPVGVAVVALVTAVAAAFALSPPIDSLPDSSALFGAPPQPASAERVAPKPASAESAEQGCSTDAAKGLIKAELFERASRLRGSDPSILTPVADRSLVRIDLAEA
jgi:curved DNA-binding protein CbpA